MRQNDDFRCGARSQVLPRIKITSQLLRVWNYRGARERTHAEAGGDRAAGQLRRLLSWRGGDSLLQRRAHLGARKQRTGLVSGKDPATEVARLGRDLPRRPAELGGRPETDDRVTLGAHCPLSSSPAGPVLPDPGSGQALGLHRGEAASWASCPPPRRLPRPVHSHSPSFGVQPPKTSVQLSAPTPEPTQVPGSWQAPHKSLVNE